MFKEKKKEPPTDAQRRQSLMRNRFLVYLVIGALIYSFFQARTESTPMPIWFILTMSALIAVGVVVLLYNYKLVREYDRFQAENGRESSDTAEEAGSMDADDAGQTPPEEEQKEDE